MNYLFQIIFGYLLSDFIMGLYHWFKDSYFSPLTPFIGKIFIWNSRLHHIKPRYITTFSNKEIFLNSFIWTSIWAIPMIIYKFNPFTITLYSLISVNDIIHKYAHQEEKPKIISLLQKYYILQTYEEHQLHHLIPHSNYYCPISPHLNIILEKIRFWKSMEFIIEKTIRIKARSKSDKFIIDKKYPSNIKFI